MNTELRKMIVDAECRYLDESEQRRLREYAAGFRARLETSRKVEEREDVIVQRATDRLLSSHGAYAREVPDARAKSERDMRLTLRYSAGAHVRSDMDFFRRSYAEWMSELLRSVIPKEVLVAGQRALRDVVEEELDGAHARAIVTYLDVFIEELGR